MHGSSFVAAMPGGIESPSRQAAASEYGTAFRTLTRRQPGGPEPRVTGQQPDELLPHHAGRAQDANVNRMTLIHRHDYHSTFSLRVS